jgi:hypothetical protein
LTPSLKSTKYENVKISQILINWKKFSAIYSNKWEAESTCNTSIHYTVPKGVNYTVFRTANTCLNISISTCPIATYISLHANSGILVARVSNQSATSSDGALWLDTYDNKCFTIGIKWYVSGNRACAGIQCISSSNVKCKRDLLTYSDTVHVLFSRSNVKRFSKREMFHAIAWNVSRFY